MAAKRLESQNSPQIGDHKKNDTWRYENNKLFELCWSAILLSADIPEEKYEKRSINVNERLIW